MYNFEAASRDMYNEVQKLQLFNDTDWPTTKRNITSRYPTTFFSSVTSEIDSDGETDCDIQRRHSNE